MTRHSSRLTIGKRSWPPGCPSVRDIQAGLIERGLIHTKPRTLAFSIPVLIMVAPLAVAIPKLVLGVSRGKPVGYLALATAATAVAAFCFLAAVPRVTRLGSAVVGRLALSLCGHCRASERQLPSPLAHRPRVHHRVIRCGSTRLRTAVASSRHASSHARTHHLDRRRQFQFLALRATTTTTARPVVVVAVAVAAGSQSENLLRCPA